MELKSMIQMEVVKEDRRYTLSIPMGAPYGELYDAVYVMLEETVKMAKKSADNAKREEDKKEE